MARPKQDGLLYFSFDTDFFYADKRIKRLHSKYGNDGLIFYIYLLTEIYRNGYYISWDEETADDIAADLRLKEGFIEQVMTYLRGRSLLIESKLSTGVTIITSPGIQKRYQEAKKGCKRQIEVNPEIWLLNEEETASCIKVTHNQSNSERNHSNSEKNQSNSEKNTIKENKEKEKKRKENKSNKNNGASTCQYYPDELLNQAFLDYLEMRKKIKKPMTDRAVALAMKKLKELSVSPLSGNMDNDKAIKILEQSIMNCWQGLFPLKEEKKNGNSIYDEWRNA